MRIDCEECNGRGIFYFTGKDSLYDSQVCGQCHGVGSYEKQLQIYEDEWSLNGFYITNGDKEVRIESINRRDLINDFKELLKNEVAIR